MSLLNIFFPNAKSVCFFFSPFNFLSSSPWLKFRLYYFRIHLPEENGDPLLTLYQPSSVPPGISLRASGARRP